MGDGAAHMVDHVLPPVPMRQVVVSWPFEWCGKLAFQPQLLSAVERIAMSATTTWMNERTGGARTGGIFVRHRFCSAVNLHVHGHMLLLDGGYIPDGEGYTFRAAPPIRAHELDALAATIRRRMHTLFKRRGLLTTNNKSNEAEQLDALEMCGNAALG